MGIRGMGSEEDEDDFMKLCFQVETRDEFGHYKEDKWFVVNGDDNKSVEIRGMNRQFLADTVSVGSDCTVFVCGGNEYFTNSAPAYFPYYKASSDLWYTDTCVVDIDDDENEHDESDYHFSANGWISGPPMRNPRYGSRAVSVDSKIYVFGGMDCTTGSTWAEVYDIASQCWSALDPPLYIYSLHVRSCFLVVLEKKRLIIVYTSHPGCLWSYDLDKGIWDLFDPYFGTYFFELVFVYGTPFLLAIKDSVLYGYHLVRKEWFPSPVSGLEGNNVLPSNTDFFYDYYLISMGSNGKLCLIWSKSSNYDPITLQVHCTKFTVYEDGSSSSLVAKVERTTDYNFFNVEALRSCFAFAPRRVKKRVEGVIYMEEEEEINHQLP